MLLNNKYSLTKVLGQGGMGKVYLATNVETNALVAIKDCILGEDQQQVLERVKREYYFMAKMDHPNIIKSHDFFAWKNRYFIVMDYICGIDLKTFIREKKHSITFEQQLEIAKQICGAVATLNNNGVIHRDIKPANIILQQLNPILLDLGIAKSTNNELATLTKSGAIVGTPEYISPEQVHGKTDLLNSDVFSLGVMLYQFFAWMPKSPFESNNVISTIYKICNKKLPSLHTVLQSNDEKIVYVSKVIDNAIHKSPLRRTPSVEDMLKQLLQNGEEIRYFKPSKTNPLARQRQKRRQKLQKRNLAITCACLVLSIGLLLAIYYHQKLPQEMGSHYSEAMLFEYQKKHKLALESYNKAIAKNPQHFKAYTSRGNLYHLDGKFKLAKKDYDKSIEINPEYSNAYKARGNWYRDHKKFELAKQDYNTAIRLNPKYSQAYRARGHLHRDLKLYKLAEKDYSRAIEIDPQYENAYRSRGDLYRKMKKFALAAKDYKTTLEINPKNATAHCHQGILYHVQNKISLAISCYENAIKFDEKYIEAYKYLGFIYYQRYQYMLAIEHWQKAINLGLPEEEVRDLLQKAQKYLRK